MSRYTRTDYWRESFEISMEEAGCGHLLKQMTEEQINDVAGGIEGCHDNIGMAFHAPESPLRSENERLLRKLTWERELEGCRECGGSGRLRYNAGPWGVNTGCHHCQGAGKVHALGFTFASFVLPAFLFWLEMR